MKYSLLSATAALALLLAPIASAAAAEVSINTFDRRTVEGELKSITAAGVVVEAGGAETTIASKDLHSLSLKSSAEPPGEKPSAWVELGDGSRLPAQDFTLKDGKATIKLTDGAELRVTARQLRSVRFSKLDDAQADPAAPEAAGDLMGVRKRDSVDFLEGVIGDVTKVAVVFTVDGQAIPVNPSRVDSLVFARRAGDQGNEATPACIVEENTGALLQAKLIELKDNKFTVTLLSGASVVRPLAGVRRLDFSAGKLTYLSDLKPESVRFTPFFDLGKQSPALAKFLGPRFDRGREDELMRLDGKTYSKGVSLTSRTELVYRLPAQAKHFRATAGIDDGVGNLGSVQLQIKGDDRQLYSGKLTGRDAPVDLDLDLAGVRRLTILVDFGDDLDVGDHLDLCEARIVK
jgi:hypothetical protein